MPTFICFTSPGKLAAVQKEEIAHRCTAAYAEEFGIARYLVQVVFYEIASGDRYIAGEPAQPDVIWLRCDIRAGRTEEMKARLLHRFRQDIAKTANVPDEAVWIYLCELPSMNIMAWGHIMPQPGAVPYDDDTWFEKLSAPLKASLRPLA